MTFKFPKLGLLFVTFHYRPMPALQSKRTTSTVFSMQWRIGHEITSKNSVLLSKFLVNMNHRVLCGDYNYIQLCDRTLSHHRTAYVGI